METSVLGSCSLGIGVQAKQMIAAVRPPLITALSDPLNKYSESILQKLLFETKNANLFSVDEEISATSKEFDGIYEKTTSHYSQNEQNARANLARSLGLFANSLHAARKAYFNNKVDSTINHLASAFSQLRTTHNEVPPDNEFYIMTCQALFSRFIELNSNELSELSQQIKHLEQNAFNEERIQNYYQSLSNCLVFKKNDVSFWENPFEQFLK